MNALAATGQIGYGLAVARQGGSAPVDTPWYMAAGVTPIAAYSPVGAASQADSYINLVNPGTYNAAPGTAPTWNTATGWTFNGSNQYLTTGIVPAAGWTMLCKFSNASGDGKFLVGSRTGTAANQFLLAPRLPSTGRRYGYGTQQLNLTGALTQGIMALAGGAAYIDGTYDGTAAAGTFSLAVPALYLGACNNNGSVLGPQACNIESFVIFDTTLTATQIIDLTDAMVLHTPSAQATAFNGIWSWFTNPRALHDGSKTYVGLLSPVGGDIRVMSLDDATGAGINVLLYDNIGNDDHNHPSLLLRHDGHLMAWYCEHNGSTIHQRVSLKPNDIRNWQAETSLDSQLGHEQYTYPTPVQLTGESNNPIYLFYRCFATPQALFFSKSTDGGTTWTTGLPVFGDGTNRPYFHAIRNGNNRIDFVVTDGHPSEVSTNSIYHCYYTGGNLYKTDGTLIGAIGSGPYTPATHLTRVYNGATNRAWNWDIAIDGSGHPVIVYAQFLSSATDHRYRYARWNGSAWTDNEIVAGGTYLYASELYYSGGVCLDYQDVNTVYVSKQVSSQWEIWKYTTADNGATWDAGTAITTGSSNPNIRPFVPLGGGPIDVFWVSGTYTSFTSFSMSLMSEPSYYS